MSEPGRAAEPASARFLGPDDLDRLIQLVGDEGYRVVGPTVGDGAIIYDDIVGVADLPVGMTDEQGPGRYRLTERGDRALFGYAVGPHSWKRFLFPPRETLVHIRRSADAPVFEPAMPDGAPLALLGVRACELAAIDVQDRVFRGGPFEEARYAARRDDALLIAVSCVEAGALCFCASMGTGPEVGGGADLVLTETGAGLVARAGSPRGEALLERAACAVAPAEAIEEAADGVERCRQSMGRTLDTRDLPGMIFGNLDHPRWDDVASRCLACGNCTQVCPTCFCFDVHDTSLLTREPATRERAWDSCFGLDHSTIHGAAFRGDIRARYRQWLSHKLASWTSQFDTSGCVGCGRCIAWCPVGIDITEEAAALREGAAPAIELPAAREYERQPGDPLVAIPAAVLAVRRETVDVVTLDVAAPDGYLARPGQFNMLAIPGVGDVPISVSGFDHGRLQHTIRGVGAASRALEALRVGETLGLRGPFGSWWPLDEARGRPVMVIAGGIGLAPLRGAVRVMARRPEDYPHLRIVYGTRDPDNIVFDAELLGWDGAAHVDVSVTVDRAGPDWMGNVGVVTRLMRRKALDAGAIYLICGPEIMMLHVLRMLLDAGVPPTGIYLTMERNMKCAAGFCGRCQYGPYFICKDGPVFRYDQISFLFGRPGF